MEEFARTKKEESEEIARHVKEFLDNGGRIEILATVEAKPVYSACKNIFEIELR